MQVLKDGLATAEIRHDPEIEVFVNCSLKHGAGTPDLKGIDSLGG